MDVAFIIIYVVVILAIYFGSVFFTNDKSGLEALFLMAVLGVPIFTTLIILHVFFSIREKKKKV